MMKDGFPQQTLKLFGQWVVGGGCECEGEGEGEGECEGEGEGRLGVWLLLFHLLEILSVGWSSSQVDFSVGYSCFEERSGDESGLIVVSKELLVELAEFQLDLFLF